MIIATVLTLIGVAAVNRGNLEIEGMGVRQKYTLQVNCIEAARQLVLSQLALSGTQPSAFSISRVIGDLTLQTGHYDSVPGPGYVTVDNNAGNCGTGSGSTSGSGNLPTGPAYGNFSATNFGGQWGAGSGAGATAASACGVRVPVVCKDGSGRQLEIEFLVRLGI
jgi:hypothetical protein